MNYVKTNDKFNCTLKSITVGACTYKCAFSIDPLKEMKNIFFEIFQIFLNYL